MKSLIAILLMMIPLSPIKAGVVVVNSVNNSELPESKIVNIFLGKDTKFVPVAQKAGSAIAIKFNSTMIKRTENQLKAYWARKIFTSEGKPPREFNTDLEVVEFIKKYPNAVGYLESDVVPEGLKVIALF